MLLLSRRETHLVVPEDALQYPQADFPYADLIAVDTAQGKSGTEILAAQHRDFDGSRYFDIVVEYAKSTPEDLLMQVTVHNRGPEDAELHVLLATLWFRHTCSWAGGAAQPSLRMGPQAASHQTGWTGTVGLLPLLFRRISAEGLRTGGRGAIKSASALRRTGVTR